MLKIVRKHDQNMDLRNLKRHKILREFCDIKIEQVDRYKSLRLVNAKTERST